jgi:hypothetical protein
MSLPTLRRKYSCSPPESPTRLRGNVPASPRENPQTLGFPATLVEFFAPSAHQLRRVHSPPVYLTGYVPPTGFFTLSTAYSSPERLALFHARNARGVLLSRDFPSQPGPASSSPQDYPLGVFPHTDNHKCCCVGRLVRASLSARSPNHTSPPGLCSGCESVPWEDCYIRNPAADSLLSFFASPEYCPTKMATLRATCSLMRFSRLTTLDSTSKLDETSIRKQGALQRFHHQAWNPTLTSEISSPEVLWPSITSNPNDANVTNPVRFWPDSAFLPRRTFPSSQGLLGRFFCNRFGK